MFLDKIVDNKKKEIEKIKSKKNSLKSSLEKEEITLIAEIKKASPSKGIISKDFDPDSQLEAYIKGGADAVSILTDEEYFQGSTELLQRLKKKTTLPILRKDFIIDAVQIYQSLFLGADVILLIASILSQKELREFLHLTEDLGMEALVEVHNLEDLEKVLNTDTQILGINNRDLTDFSVNIKNTEKILDKLAKKSRRKDFYIISESGIKEKKDIDYLKSLGVDGVLIGEALMRENNPISKIRELFPEKEKILNG
ncbi:indole-3-glycerol phosphate synthase [Petrotoga sp. 9PW.55.5.1]|uniref:indole-3-glycerol phosphate synthase TrpC n=1 Tax=Petrotoga sp. 9PW.55.5.1 TaxID=1308979 RepID=UPI000DC21079|nr:indole-3-glycerol phosphate synthase TrpC [Petrotoga sp. 9PW.55.5.1]RAO98812.1 indole-3-glycerol phosphate synthase [Petrotoga sp. 9PW.55.5.1]